MSPVAAGCTDEPTRRSRLWKHGGSNEVRVWSGGAGVRLAWSNVEPPPLAWWTSQLRLKGSDDMDAKEVTAIHVGPRRP
jgi:hypothetical protein